MNSHRRIGEIWEKAYWHHIGGIYQVGFGNGKDLLVVHTSNGLSLFNTITGERVERDKSVLLAYEQCISLVVPGLGPLAGEAVRMAGIWGGGLRKNTVDNYHLSRNSSKWPLESVFIRLLDKQNIEVEDSQEGELRAYGFSDTGKSFIVATSSSLNIYKRLTSSDA